MSWRNILKATEVVWDFGMGPIGQYIPPRFSRQLGLSYELKRDEDDNVVLELKQGTIKINPNKVFQLVRNKLKEKGMDIFSKRKGKYLFFEQDANGQIKREYDAKGNEKYLPTPLLEELTAKAFKRVVMHEAGHSAHHVAEDKKFFGENPGDSLDMHHLEYAAFISEYPESIYDAYKDMLTHINLNIAVDNETWRQYQGKGSSIFPVTTYKDTERLALIRSRISYVEKWAKTKGDREKLLRMEVSWAKGKNRFVKKNFPQNLKQALARYGTHPEINTEEYRNFIKRLFGGK